ncbi:hypothetical protein ACQ4PT_060451 [Festuca glaucescens]
MESASDPEVEENPDVWELFRHYDRLYFRGALDDAAFAVEWTSPRMKTCSRSRSARAPVFAAAVVWFIVFAFAGLVACCCRCCRGKTISDYSYSRKKFAVSLILVLAFTAAAVVGCAVLYDGQGKLDGKRNLPRALSRPSPEPPTPPRDIRHDVAPTARRRPAQALTSSPTSTP